MIPSRHLHVKVLRELDRFPVVLLLGPRQCGKTTLARQLAAAQSAVFFDLEDPESPLRPETAMLITA